MAKFSVNYSGLAAVESRLHELYRKVAQVGGILYTAAGKAGSTESLENKDYEKYLRKYGVDIGKHAEEFRDKANILDEVGHAYSKLEMRVLQGLDECVSSGGFSGASASVVQGAIEGHRTYQRENYAGREIQEATDPSNITRIIERERYWRSTKGARILEKAKGVIPGEFDDLIIDKALKKAKKKSQVDTFGDVLAPFQDPTNPDAWDTGFSAVAHKLGFGTLYDAGKEAHDTSEVVNERVAEMWHNGDKAGAIGYTVEAYTLMTLQFTGNVVHGIVDSSLNVFFPGGYKKAKGVVEDYLEVGLGFEEHPIDNFFSDIGDEAWSRLDSRYHH